MKNFDILEEVQLLSLLQDWKFWFDKVRAIYSLLTLSLWICNDTSLVIRFKLLFVIDCPVGFNSLVAGCLYVSRYHLRPQEAIKLHFTVPSVLQLIFLEWNRNDLEKLSKAELFFLSFLPHPPIPSCTVDSDVSALKASTWLPQRPV